MPRKSVQEYQGCGIQNIVGQCGYVTSTFGNQKGQHTRGNGSMSEEAINQVQQMIASKHQSQVDESRNFQ